MNIVWILCIYAQFVYRHICIIDNLTVKTVSFQKKIRISVLECLTIGTNIIKQTYSKQICYKKI